jgi:hypothetical protein
MLALLSARTGKKLLLEDYKLAPINKNLSNQSNNKIIHQTGKNTAGFPRPL